MGLEYASSRGSNRVRVRIRLVLASPVRGALVVPRLSPILSERSDAAFNKACAYLNFNAPAKWTAHIAAAGTALVYVSLLLVLWLFIDLMVSRWKDFLETLNKISAEGAEIDIYKDNLDDAIEGTRDAMNDAEKAKKSVAPPPVRRKN